MKQAKKIFTRMCINNWGGISHKMLHFHEYVNLFSGKSGSGKSTVMDAIQVILYGSFSPSFLNKAADDAKNRRSVLSYLRGEQKDGTANREGQDFNAVIALELKDTGTQAFTCIGIAFEVRSMDAEIKKYMYFSHAGKMPENGYLTEENIPYSNKEIKKLIEERSLSEENRSRGDVNRIYHSREAYLNTLYDVILGYVDGNRFITMEKSAIALKMTNGTGQFIRDYMFPKSEGDTIGKISEQLGAYRDIREKIEDLKKRIDLLEEVKEAGQRLLDISAQKLQAESMIRCIDILDLQNKLRAWEEDSRRLEEELERCRQNESGLKTEREKIQNELIRVTADLKSSDLGSKQARLRELEKRSEMLSDNSRQWQRILTGLRRWEEDEVITDYISNPLLNKLQDFAKGGFTEEECRELHCRIEEAKQDIEAELETCLEEKKEVGKRLKEKQKLIDDMKNNRKSYPERLRQARAALEQRLSDVYGRTIHVHILADLFDIVDEEWKNAVEGRMGKLKFALVTEPFCARDAAALFREMKQFDEVELLNTIAITASQPRALENSLYEAVRAKEEYVDLCLQRYLGHIRKCRSIEELEKVKDGVTPDGFSSSNFLFRHLRKKDYTTYACIGSKVSRARLEEYESDAKKLQKSYEEAEQLAGCLRAARDFESLREDAAYILRLSKADREQAQVEKEKEALEKVIATLQDGEYKALEESRRQLEAERSRIQQRLDENQEAHIRCERARSAIASDISAKKQQLAEQLQGYFVRPEVEEAVKKALEGRSGQAVRSEKNGQIARLTEQEQQETENLHSARNRYIFAYPSCGFNGAEYSNESYEKLLAEYRQDYEPKYQAEFEKQCNLIYKSLRENVIATIHGDIRAAKRHTLEINRLLRNTNFSDSTYQIKIEPAKNENGQFYEMLTAPELDSKMIDNDGFEGQMSLGEDLFYQKYAAKIDLLTDKFMPVKATDEKALEARRREMEQYADYRNYLSFSMFEQVTDEQGNIIRENPVDEMAGRDSGGEGQNPKYVALLAGFAMLYMQQSSRDAKIKLVLLDEAFSKMDQERSAVCLKYARQMDLQLIVCVPDERLQSLIRNVDSVYGFRRHLNRISMMHIDKGDYLKLMEGESNVTDPVY